MHCTNYRSTTAGGAETFFCVKFPCLRREPAGTMGPSIMSLKSKWTLTSKAPGAGPGLFFGADGFQGPAPTDDGRQPWGPRGTTAKADCPVVALAHFERSDVFQDRL